MSNSFARLNSFIERHPEHFTNDNYLTTLLFYLTSMSHLYSQRLEALTEAHLTQSDTFRSTQMRCCAYLLAARAVQDLLNPTPIEGSGPTLTPTVTPELLSNFAARIASLSPPANLPTAPPPSLADSILEAKLTSDLSDIDEELADYLNGHGSGPDPSTDLVDDLDPYDGRDINDQ